MVRYKNIKIFTGNANPQLASEITEYLGMELSHATVTAFSDGEVNLSIGESVRGADCYIIQPTCMPVNDNLMELLIMTDALRRASAKRITAVLPYYGYARQDRKSKARDPITAKLVANLLVQAGADRILAVDLHAGQIQGFFDIPVDHLNAANLVSEHFKNTLPLEDVVVVSPDVGGVTRARVLAEALHVPLAIIDKRRPAPNVAEIMHIIGEVKGKKAIMIDDIIDTAGTITLGAKTLLERDAEEVYACGIHPVLSGPAIDRLQKSVLKELTVTNTIPLAKEKRISRIKIISIAPLIGEAIIRIHEDISVSKLFV
ncbi:MAG: ribose-phosphate pyrophosphokinase [Peptococcaceae bacterium]|jgi:ribose-phosphate pyrophosphokinase|nr:ribose-phosphate pyrophosphokinase [Peptococcaceae bacterium]